MIRTRLMPVCWAALFIVTPLAINPGLMARKAIVRPYETGTSPVSTNQTDALVRAQLQKRGIRPADICSDEVFVRRAYVDMLGTLPGPDEVRAFLADPRPDKRAALVESLFGREEFARLDAEVLADALSSLFGVPEQYSSRIPDPSIR